MDGLEKTISLGLSPEEKNDLEALILASRMDHADSPAPSASEKVGQRISALSDQVAQLAGIILEMDERMNLLYRIVQLSHRKSELLQGRLDGLLSRTKHWRSRS